MANRADVYQAVEVAVSEWRGPAGSGPLSLSGDIRPVGGVSGFDSYSGIVATVELGVGLGVVLTSDNIFLTPDGSRARKVEQIVDEICKELGGDLQ